MNLFELTKELISIPSVSGEEQKIAEFLRYYLQTLGYEVKLQEVADGRSNVVAWASDNPRVFFSTHMDTVPPFIPVDEDDENIRGRGACDAKGVIAAQIFAAEKLRKENVSDVGLLFTIDEEQGSTGARAANALQIAKKCEYLINGEPTDNQLAIGSKGSLRAFLRVTGKAAHSAYPEEGDSAIVKLINVLTDIQQTNLPTDDFFGETTLNIGTIAGGLKTNVVPPSAEAGLHVRLVTDEKQVLDALEKTVAGRGKLEVASVALPIKMLAVEGFEQKVVRFTTDVPHLTNWGQPLLLGPGSILVAHTEKEFVAKKDLEQAVELYSDLAKKLLR